MRYHSPVATFHVENFGCRATQADGAALEHQLASRGLDRASASDADLVVFNTCTVTNSADQDARAAIRRLRRQNPRAKIVVTGCYAQRAPGEVAALPGVTCVIGNSHKHQLAELVLPKLRTNWHETDPERCALNRAPKTASSQALAGERKSFIPLNNLIAQGRRPEPQPRLYVSDIFAHTELLAAPVFDSGHHDRTRPNLKVQDGCDNRCSFCVIPSVRGHSRSLPGERVLQEVNTLVAAGYRELVISGINLGRWGRDLGFGPQALGYGQPAFSPNTSYSSAGNRSPKAEARSLTSLIRAILDKTSLEKLRISSVEPMDWTDDLISLVADSPRVAKHAHVPLQSASDAVLRRMHRKYRPWHYREKIEKIHAAVPTAAIGADVMVGFPGEADADFECTRRLIAGLPFTYLHVFTYSARPGTPAATMPNQVPVQVSRERNKILRDLAAEKKSAFMQSFIGTQLQAITLNEAQDSAEGQFTEALTDNYQKLLLKGRHAPNRWITAQIERVEEGALIGSVM